MIGRFLVERRVYYDEMKSRFKDFCDAHLLRDKLFLVWLSVVGLYSLGIFIPIIFMVRRLEDKTKM